MTKMPSSRCGTQQCGQTHAVNNDAVTLNAVEEHTVPLMRWHHADGLCGCGADHRTVAEKKRAADVRYNRMRLRRYLGLDKRDAVR